MDWRSVLRARRNGESARPKKDIILSWLKEDDERVLSITNLNEIGACVLVL